MRFYFLLIFSCTVLIGCSKKTEVSIAPPEEEIIPPVPGWDLVWHDEFSRDNLNDKSMWKFEYGPNWSNGELQYYTNNRPENVRVKDGMLVLEAVNESYQGKNYTSTRINSSPGWKYGRMEIRAKLPKGNGLWPALWMLPVENFYGGWPNSGELDIMENWSWNQTGIYGTAHTEAYNHTKGTQKGGNISVTAPWSYFHTYVIEWTSSTVTWKVDDNTYYVFKNEGNTAAWPFNIQFRFIFNIAVEGSAPGQESTWTKRTMEIDYVRVYSKSQ
ncbi:MAG: family 16 glycosylhydrolase [Methanococcaceae archaeon]